MFSRDVNQNVDSFIVIHWLLMSLFAGVLNAIAFIGLGTFATHVTGFATLIGVNAAENNWSNALAALTVPFFFLLGTTISGLCVEAQVIKKKVPHYDYVMYFSSFLLLLAALIARKKELITDVSHLHIESNFVLLSLICLASGLINAALSYSSRSTVRVTHLTGITTDLGRGIALLIGIRGNQIEINKSELRINFLRTLTIGAFILGSILGAYMFHWFLFNALVAPALYFIYVGRHGKKNQELLRLTHKIELPPAKSSAP